MAKYGHRVDEVKDLRDKAEAMRAYARQAKNKQLDVDAAEIRIRAERRAGELLAEMEKNSGAMGTASNQYQQVRSHGDTVPPTLATLGLNKSQSSRRQKKGWDR
jgi:hypothetical protein